jgi:hypothetical protein
MLAFRQSIRGQRCVRCRRDEHEAFAETGFGHEAHHGLRQAVLRDLGLDAWDVRLAVPVCVEPCHRRHTQRYERLRRSMLPAPLLEFVREHQLDVELGREYPA